MCLNEIRQWGIVVVIINAPLCSDRSCLHHPAVLTGTAMVMLPGIPGALRDGKAVLVVAFVGRDIEGCAFLLVQCS